MKKEFLFDADIMPSSQAGRAGVLALANENRFASSTYSEPVTEFVLGVLGTDLAALRNELELIMPSVRVPRRFEYRKEANALSFLSDLDDERAIGASFRRLEQKGELVQAKTANRGLSYTIDRDEMVEGQVEQVAKWLTAILLRNSKRRAISVIGAAAGNNDVVFSAATDPDGLIEAKLIAALEARGLYPNNIIAGIRAWSLRKTAYRSSVKPGALALSSMTPADVAQVLAVDRFTVSKDVFKPGAKKAKQPFLANMMYAYFIDDIISKEDESNVKRFYTPCANGEEFRVFVDESQAKTIEVIVEMYSTEAVVDNQGIVGFTVTATAG